MPDNFGQVHWRTHTNFNDKKAPESCDAGAFYLPKITYRQLFARPQLVGLVAAELVVLAFHLVDYTAWLAFPEVLLKSSWFLQE
jgi:hypothetical protein